MTTATELIPVLSGTIGTQTSIQTVKGRDLWNGLEIKGDYTSWARYQIEALGGVGDEDFTTFMEIQEREVGATARREYYFTLDFAKHIAMVSKTPKGREVRDYFIEVEKTYRTPPITTATVLFQAVEVLLKHERRLDKVEKRIATLDGSDGYVSVRGYFRLIGIRNPTPAMSRAIGKRATSLCLQRGIEIQSIPDKQWGKLNTYPKPVLDETFDAYQSWSRGMVAAV
jgi:phage anti-repressor protein